MTEYISTEAGKILDNPTEGEEVTLLLGIDDDIDSVEQHVCDIGASETERLAYSTLVATVEETDVRVIEQLDAVIAIEVEGTIELLDKTRTTP